MQHILAIFLALCLSFVALPEVRAEEAPPKPGVRLAMISDHGGITDRAFNQTIYEACMDYARVHGTSFTCFQLTDETAAERHSIIEDAANQEYNVIVTLGDLFAETIKNDAHNYPKVTFIAIDVAPEDFDADDIPANLYGVSFQEELSGYMAGYAAVRLGYKKIGYLGGMEVPAVKRYGYGFVQGVNAAAKETKNADISLNYAYAGGFEPDKAITNAMKKWYKDGVEIVFACGGGIYKSVAEAAKETSGKIIGVDVDQAGIIDGDYGDGLTVTSAMKDLTVAVRDALEKATYKNLKCGQVEKLGLTSEDPAKNFVKLPLDTTQWNSNFTQQDYKTLAAEMFNGKVTVSSDLTKSPADFAKNIALQDVGKIK